MFLCVWLSSCRFEWKQLPTLQRNVISSNIGIHQTTLRNFWEGWEVCSLVSIMAAGTPAARCKVVQFAPAWHFTYNNLWKQKINIYRNKTKFRTVLFVFSVVRAIDWYETYSSGCTINNKQTFVNLKCVSYMFRPLHSHPDGGSPRKETSLKMTNDAILLVV